MSIVKIGFGGGCHWCTEGVFASLKGVESVDQGWIASEGEQAAFSEAVIVHFDPAAVSQHTLIEVHLLTHASTSEHSMRGKYRSAVYAFDAEQLQQVQASLKKAQAGMKEAIITQALLFSAFRLNSDEFLDYFQKNPEKAFCQRYIHPKIERLRKSHQSLLKA